MGIEAQQYKDIKTRLIFVLAPWIYKIYMVLVYLTSRKTHIGFDDAWERIGRGEKVIAALWHKDIVLAPFAYRGKNIITLASKSKDGEIIARVIERLGFKVVRGSSSKGGSSAIKNMVEYLNNSEIQIAAITVDGPRGPARKVKPGILFLAKKSGALIYPISCRAKRNLSLKNWDRTMIPIPFNHLVFHCGEFIKVSEDTEESDFQQLKKGIELSLQDLHEIPYKK